MPEHLLNQVLDRLVASVEAAGVVLRERLQALVRVGLAGQVGFLGGIERREDRGRRGEACAFAGAELPGGPIIQDRLRSLAIGPFIDQRARFLCAR